MIRQSHGLLLRLRLLLMAASVAVFAGSIDVSETRYVPEGWTQPEITRDSQGNMSFKPAVPTGFKKRSVGAGIAVDQATVHARPVVLKETYTPVKRHGTDPKSYDLTLKDGTVVRVTEGETMTIGEDSYTVQGIRKGMLSLQGTGTKPSRRFSR